jgi:hypothetical protein
MVISGTEWPATYTTNLKKGGDCDITSKYLLTSEVKSYKMDPAKVKNLSNIIPKFSRQNEEI